MTREQMLEALGGLADSWSRESAAVPTPDYVPGKPNPAGAGDAARAATLDKCADSLRRLVAGWAS